ncbi:hypothetical protein [Ramlibacter sp. WS9]|uniref:hypothetical protein n=1 Tax=Ramlibacter sp. WS9 TaxID=1882741 RepID=UPI00130544C1|nr:hypothetical protein [Ramlibacter sp. WS9]
MLFNLRKSAILLCALGSSAYAASNSTDPNDLQAPREITCVHLAEPLELTALYGSFNVQWTTRLEKGPYWSEKVDADGTYFRAPIGGVSVRGKSGGAFPGQPTTTDGGFYVPNNAAKPITLYSYFSTEPVSPQITQASSCTEVAFVKDTNSKKVDLVALTTGGAIGGAVGGALGTSLARGSTVSVGQAAGTGAAGGAIGTFLIGAIINAGVGKIVWIQPPIKDAQFLDKLKALADKRVGVGEAQLTIAPAK